MTKLLPEWLETRAGTCAHLSIGEGVDNIERQSASKSPLAFEKIHVADLLARHLRLNSYSSFGSSERPF
jgi:hypothetical protein